MIHQLQTAQERIKEATIALILEQGFDKTSVSKIIKKAAVHRSTFYAYYKDKYDLLEQLQDQLIMDLHHFLLNGKAFLEISPAGDVLVSEEQVLSMLGFIKEQKDYINAMSISESGSDFFLRFRNEYDQVVDAAYEEAGVRMSHHPVIPEDYYDELLMESLFVTIRFWLQKDCLESPQEITKIIMHISRL